MRSAQLRTTGRTSGGAGHQHLAPAERPPLRGRGWPAWTLVAVELLVAYQAVSGGIGLVRDSWQLPVTWRKLAALPVA